MVQTICGNLWASESDVYVCKWSL